MKKAVDHIIVIGASAGGFTAVTNLIKSLNKEINAAIFIALHWSKLSNAGLFAEKLRGISSINVAVAENELPIAGSTVYIAPANKHLLLNKTKMLLGYGPAEDRWRPSIDILFRSAAAAFNSAVTGIILTGLLYDGTAGMITIRRSGGKCIVQDPKEAAYNAMPLNVLDNIEPDYILRLDEMPAIIERIVQTVPAPAEVPEDILQEASIAEKIITTKDIVSKIGDQSEYICPECGGMLWKMKDKKTDRYRCHIGHAFTEGELLSRQEEKLESTLWIALRIMEERQDMLNKMADNARKKDYSKAAREYISKADSLNLHINKLKEMLLQNNRAES